MKALSLCAVFAACAPCYDAQPNYTSYLITVSQRSVLGYGIDDPDHELDLVRLDHVVQDTAKCAGAEVRSCLVIKTAPDWHLESAACQAETSVQDDQQPQQLFGSAPAASCEAKGENPTSGCPCQFRAIIQTDTATGCEAVVTTPDMEILSGQLVTMFTGDPDPWGDSLSDCANVSVNGGE